MLIFSGTSNPQLAEQIAHNLGASVSPLEIHIFPDGEKRVRVIDSVVGKDVVVIEPTNPPVDSNYMELFFILDALSRSGTQSITAVVPYFGYQRQDHIFRDGEAVSLDVIIHLLENRGVGRLIVFDLHSIKIPELFHIPVIHLSALPLFAEEITKRGWDTGDSVLISPDMGGVRRIKILSEQLGNMPYAAIEKNRDLETGSIEAQEIHGDLKKRAIIVDDMISSGGTIDVASKLLKKRGVEKVFVFATHAVFSDDAPKTLEESNAEKIFVTDTIHVSEAKQFEKLEVLSVAEMIASELRDL